MSANNFIKINKKTFKVEHCDADTLDCSKVGQGKKLEEAIEIAEAFKQKLESEGSCIEYGIHFSE